MEDLAAEHDRERSLERVEWIHDRKTGALITAALEVGALAGSAAAGPPTAALPLLRAYGDCVGRAFQIADDCLDLTGSAGELGKNPGADLARDKLTWPAMVGLDQSLATARKLAEQAAALAPELVAVARGGRRARAELDDVVPLLQDCALAAVVRRN
jgi:geranylgeranyl pyrophosphate synthase